MSGFDDVRKFLSRGLAGVKVALSEGRLVQIPAPTNPKQADGSAVLDTLQELLKGLTLLGGASALHAGDIVKALGQINEEASSMQKASPQVLEALKRASEALKAAKDAAPSVSKDLFTPLEEKIVGIEKFFGEMKDYTPGPVIVEETVCVRLVGPKEYVQQALDAINKAVDETELRLVIKAGVENDYRLGLTSEARGRKLVASKDGVQIILHQNKLDASAALSEAGLGQKEPATASQT
jgi:hypothetical protein